MLERFGQSKENELSKEAAFEALKNRENELLKTNEVQIKLSQIFFPEEATLEDMMMRWATSEERYSDQYRKLIESDKDIKERIMKDDETVIEEIAKRLSH